MFISVPDPADNACRLARPAKRRYSQLTIMAVFPPTNFMVSIMQSANRNWIKLLAGIAVLAIAAIAYFSLSAPQAAPNVTYTGLDGQKFTSESLKGKVVMVNFWATWCVPCRQEMPHLQALYERYNSLGFELLAVNVDKNNAEGARKWLEETPVSFPVLFDPNNEVTKLYKVQTMPSTVLVARDGTMRFIHHGYKPGYENDYQTQVRALLRE